MQARLTYRRFINTNSSDIGLNGLRTLNSGTTLGAHGSLYISVDWLLGQ